MKFINKAIFEKVNFEPFKEYKKDDKKFLMYRSNELEGYNIYMSELIVDISNDNNVIRVLINDDYYKASEAMFEDPVLDELFDYWPMFKKLNKKRKLSVIINYIIIPSVFLYWISKSVLFLLPTIFIAFLTIYFIVSMKKLVRKINAHKGKVINIMGEEKNNELANNINKYYEDRALEIKKLNEQDNKVDEVKQLDEDEKID